MFGVKSGSIPNLDRRKSGVDADINVGIVECRSAVGAREKGNVQLGRVFKVASIDRGGWVDGVRISLVRAMSIGARIIPAMPAAETATVRDARGEGDDNKSSPPT